MIDRNQQRRATVRAGVFIVLLVGLAGCGGASVFTDDTLVRANDAPVTPVARDAVPAVQSDGFPNPQQPTAPPIARDLTTDERADLKADLESVRDAQAAAAASGQPQDRAAAIRKAAADRKKKILQEIEENERSQ